MSRLLRYLFLAAALWISAPVVSIGQPAEFINVGIKLTHGFGAKNFVSAGLEASWTTLSDFKNVPTVQGAVLNIDWLGDRVRFHVGYEATFLLLAGVEAGPSLIFEKDATYLAGTLSVYAGAIVFAQYSWTTYKRDTFGELALLIKFPILVSGSFEFF